MHGARVCLGVDDKSVLECRRRLTGRPSAPGGVCSQPPPMAIASGPPPASCASLEVKLARAARDEVGRQSRQFRPQLKFKACHRCLGAVRARLRGFRPAARRQGADDSEHEPEARGAQWQRILVSNPNITPVEVHLGLVLLLSPPLHASGVAPRAAGALRAPRQRVHARARAERAETRIDAGLNWNLACSSGPVRLPARRHRLGGAGTVIAQRLAHVPCRQLRVACGMAEEARREKV